MPSEDQQGLSRRELMAGAAAAGLTVAVPGLGTGCASAQGASGPGNVVVVVIDSLRTDHVGAYGGRRARTPALDALARESLVFEHARHEAMPTGPVRKSVLVGQSGYPFHGWKRARGLPDVPGWEGIARDERTFLDVLDRRGYLTGYVTDNPHLMKPAFANFRTRPDVMRTVKGQVPGFRVRGRKVSQTRLRRHLAPELRGADRERVREYLSYNGARRGDDDYLSARVLGGAIDFVERAASEDRPFGLVVDCFDVHEPWDPPDRWLGRYARIKRGGYRPIQPFATPAGKTADISKRTLKLTQRMYAAEVSFLDHWLGRLLDRVDELAPGNTWVVVVSDHGVMLGEHGLIGKTSNALYSELLDVPFMIRHPKRVGAGKRTRYFASSHDIAPTLLKGVGAPVPKAMDGVDLRPLLDGGRPRERRPVWTTAWSSKLLAGDGRWLLVADNDRGRLRDIRLHDRRRDPREQRDVARANPKVVRRLTKALRREAGKQGFPRL
ncbi:MAG: sulfatase [Thermoleophilaceae bacterium]